MAYFPLSAVAEGVLEPAEHTTRHRDFGSTSWYTVRAGTGSTPRAAWQHTELPGFAEDLKGRVGVAIVAAFNAFYWLPIRGESARDPDVLA